MTEEYTKQEELRIAVIPDGNRRASKRLMKNPFMGHAWGVDKTKELIGWCRELNIKEITLYAFSLKNFNRPKKEFDFLMKLFVKAFKENKDDPEIHENRVKIDFIGRIHMFPKEVQEAMHNLMEATKNYYKFRINIAMAYDGRAEAVDAIKKIAKQVKEGKIKIEDIDEDLVKKNLYMSSDVDLIIRTSGEKRTSSFLPLQADYAELVFIEDYWPDLKKEQFVDAINDFKKRDRRFGK